MGDVGLGEVLVEGQAQDLRAGLLGGGQRAVPGREGGLEVVGRVVDADADVCLAQVREDLVPSGQADLAQVGHGVVGADVDERDLAQAGEGGAVGAPQVAAGGGGLFEGVELGEADRRVEARELVAQAEAVDLVGGGPGAFAGGVGDTQQPEAAEGVCFPGGAGDDGAALAAGQILERAEGEAAAPPNQCG